MTLYKPSDYKTFADMQQLYADGYSLGTLVLAANAAYVVQDMGLWFLNGYWDALEQRKDFTYWGLQCHTTT